MIAEIPITPVGGAGTFPRLVASVVQALADTRLLYQVNAMGTAVEGEFDEILDAFRRVHEAARKHGGRVLVELAVDDRDGAEGELVRSLEEVARLEVGVPLQRLVKASTR